MQRPTKRLNVICNEPDEILVDLWQKTSEFMKLKLAYTQGYIALAEEMDEIDNPYEILSPEFCFWLSGYQLCLKRKTEECQI